MKATIGCLIGLVFVVSASAEPLLEGRVRLESGELVADAQVQLFDLSDLRQGAIARAMTDGTGYFALPLAALGGRALPERFALGPNYPNPFNPSTIIPYQLAASAAVRLEVFNLLGQHIATLVDGERPAGFHTATWYAVDEAGRAVGAGVYVYRMTVGVESQTGRMVLVDGQAGFAAGGAASVMPGASSGGGSDGEDVRVYGLVVSGSGLVPYVDSSFRVEAGMAPVELVVSSGPYSAGKATDDDCAFCDFFGAFNDQQEEEGESDTSETIPDANLRAAIAAALGKARGAPITVAEMKTLTWLEADDADISDLTGLEFASNLTQLWLTGNNISDVSSLSGLTNLTSLGLSSNNISDVSSLSSLTNLTNLHLIANDISDVSSLSGLTNLKWLFLFRNNISDVSSLSGLTNLTSLGLSSNNISDVSSLSSLTNLTQLWLSSNNISDVSSLSGLTNLEWLFLDRNNNISDVSFLFRLTNLEWLGLGSNNISDVSSLSGLTNLTQLWLSSNNISDVSSLSGLTNLTQLELGDVSGGNLIADVSALSGLTRLNSLSLAFNLIADVSVLRGLTLLTELDLRGNPLSDSSLNEHVPVLESSGITVQYDSFRVEGDFDIELVFLGHFTEVQKNMFRYVARRWMAVITEDLPDYELTRGWSGECGEQLYKIPPGERIDDLRIYIASFDDPGIVGYGGPRVLRETTYLPALGCMAFNLKLADLLVTGLHETGHVLGFGTIWDDLGFIQDLSSNADAHFNGPLATSAFDDAGGLGYTGNKVPVQQYGAHWRWPVLAGELMQPGGGEVLSAITVQSFADLGYGVDVTQADPYTLPSATAGKASVKVAAAMSSIRSVDVAQIDAYTLPDASPHGQERIAEGLPLIPEDDRLMGHLKSAEWMRDRGFDLRNDRLMGHLAPYPQAEPKPLIGREPIYVIDPQGRIIRTLGD